jgi:hypothetical protein
MTRTKVNEALLVIDVQNEYFTGRLPVTFPEGSLNNILRAMDHAACVGMPVAVIQHSAAGKDSPTFQKGSEGWKLHPEIELRWRDILIEKSQPGSFTGTGLEKWLRYDGAPGFSFGICGRLSLRCYRNSGCAKQRRSHLGPGSAPGGDGDAGDALCQGDGD